MGITGSPVYIPKTKKRAFEVYRDNPSTPRWRKILAKIPVTPCVGNLRVTIAPRAPRRAKTQGGLVDGSAPHCWRQGGTFGRRFVLVPGYLARLSSFWRAKTLLFLDSWYHSDILHKSKSWRHDIMHLAVALVWLLSRDHPVIPSILNSANATITAIIKSLNYLRAKVLPVAHQVDLFCFTEGGLVDGSAPHCWRQGGTFGRRFVLVPGYLARLSSFWRAKTLLFLDSCPQCRDLVAPKSSKARVDETPIRAIPARSSGYVHFNIRPASRASRMALSCFVAVTQPVPVKLWLATEHCFNKVSAEDLYIVECWSDLTKLYRKALRDSRLFRLSYTSSDRGLLTTPPLRGGRMTSPIPNESQISRMHDLIST
nr:hypothetical protein CFP56_09158 [Quercus suber]